MPCKSHCWPYHTETSNEDISALKRTRTSFINGPSMTLLRGELGHHTAHGEYNKMWANGANTMF